MEKSYGRKLVLIIGGLVRPPVNTKKYLHDVAKETGVKERNVYAAYYGEYLGRPDKEKLEQAARRKTENEYAEHIEWMRRQIQALRTADPEMYRNHIAAAEHWISALEDYSSGVPFMAVPEGAFSGGEE